MEETNLRDTLLRAEIDRIMQNEELYMTMSKSAQSFGNRDSADQIARLLIETAQNH
jgi:UDP-N-acetylglucosamine:LPS N-acetylglucosamine transferase